MKTYKQLDLQDRHKMNALLERDHSQTKIAEIIGVHKSTISRELSLNLATRGLYANEYRPDLAQRKTNQRHRDKRKHCRFTQDLKEDATWWLIDEKLSPELISGRWSVQVTNGACLMRRFTNGPGEENAKKTQPQRSSTNTSSMAIEGANEAITMIPGGFSLNEWVSNSDRHWKIVVESKSKILDLIRNFTCLNPACCPKLFNKQ